MAISMSRIVAVSRSTARLEFSGIRSEQTAELEIISLVGLLALRLIRMDLFTWLIIPITGLRYLIQVSNM